jgi:hypothetical protein
MAVAFDAFSQSHTETAVWSVSQASFSWSHNPVGVPRCAVVFVIQGVASTDATTSVTYAGATMTAVPGGTAVDTATELGRVKAYFLDNVPSNDPATVVVNRTNNTTTMVAVCITMTALGACEVYTAGIQLVQENAAWTERSVDDGSPGTNSLRLDGGYTGGATFVPIGASSTMAGQFNPTAAYSAMCCRETTVGQGVRTVGFNSAGSSDDHAEVALAVREVPPPVAVDDDFNRADSSTIGNDSDGNAWVEVSGAWEILNQVVRQTDTSTNPGELRCGTAMNTGNHWIEATLSASAGTGSVGLLARMDASAFTGLSFEVADGSYKLIDVSGGTPNTVFTGVAHTHAAGEVYGFEVSGTTNNFYLNGSLVATTTYSSYQTNRRVGLHFNDDSTGSAFAARWNNFRAGDGAYPGPLAGATDANAEAAAATGVGFDAVAAVIWQAPILMAPMVAP